MDEIRAITRRRSPLHLRLGLQLQCAVALALVVVAITVSCGWFYYFAAQLTLRENDRRKAARICEALAVAARQDLLDSRGLPLQRLVTDYIRSDGVRFVALLDASGRVSASACQSPPPKDQARLTALPVSLSATEQTDDDLLLAARPIILRALPSEPSRGELVGAVRLILDTSPTTTGLAKVRRRMETLAAAAILAAFPLVYMLAWRAFVQPIQRVVSAARRLARGDFNARTGMTRRDEIGELAAAFDAMADQVARSRGELLRANERLESRVAERTGQLQLANRRLREEMAEKEDFLRAVSHDLGAPLRNIAGMASMLMLKWRSALPEEVAARLERIRVNADVETDLICDLLELSRVRTRPEKRTAVDFSQLLREVLATLEHEIKAANITVAVQDPLPVLRVETNRLRQVFQNLLDNAVKYMDRPVGGRIEIAYASVDGMHQFSVADNGPGIPPEDHQRIFHVFRRGENARTVRVPGKGVGLALVRAVASAYDGRAWVDSTPGAGSTFYVTLSAAATRVDAETPARADVAEPAPAGGSAA